jgi:hypothetical protein
VRDASRAAYMALRLKGSIRSRYARCPARNVSTVQHACRAAPHRLCVNLEQSVTNDIISLPFVYSHGFCGDWHESCIARLC